MRRWLTFLFLLNILACQSYEEQVSDCMVSFSLTNLPQFGNVDINARQTAISGWEHILAPEVEIHITQADGGYSEVLSFASGESLPQTLILPYGSYVYEITAEGEEMEAYMPIAGSGTFDVQGPNANVIIDGQSEYGLVTVENTGVESVNLNGEDLTLTDNEEFFYMYIRQGTLVALQVNPLDTEELLTRDIEVGALQHYHFYLDASGEPNSGVVDLVLGEFTYVQEGIALEDINNIVYDVDGNRYRTVRVGNQVWMAENLRTSSYCNGDPVTREPNPEGWDDVEEGLWTYYEDREEYGQAYGKLYNGYAATDERNICPCDWRVPTQEDFQELAQYLDQDYTGPDKLKDTGFEHWKSPNTGASNETGMTMRGGGMLLRQTPQRDREENRWYYPFPLRFDYNWLHLVGGWWTQTEVEYSFWWYSTEPEPPGYRFNTLYVMEQRFNSVGDVNPRPHDGYKNEGMSIRCIKENP
ncbi:fibrobacter succinogenes major paralogous domain-containing protein [Litoribacter populi]|uniref:fibrobacter succinogenes major paralogous domain-containing protein n=1 Tax=Litoribacter populi TaxID=2598460 RepID=UPI00117FE2F7|nr:fibrobacter succinogenes major paralogous domain-containing protein [Litoribacter populi]